MGQRGFAHARHIFNQQMAARQQAGNAVLHLSWLAHNDRVKLIQKRLKFFFNVHVFNHNANCCKNFQP